MSTINVEIEIVGLCLLVPELKKSMHILLPDTSIRCLAHDLPHTAKLEYAVKDNPKKSDYTPKPLLDAAVDLSQLEGIPFQPPVLTEVANLHKITGQTVSPLLLTSSSPACVRSRIKISHGMAAPHRAQGRWLMPGHGKPVRLTNRISWKITRIPQQRISIPIQPINGNTAPGCILDLVPENRTIHLRISHVPVKESERDPCYGEAAGHFAAYYVLLPNATTRPIPRFVERVTPREKSMFGDLLTCMLAQAPVGP